MSDVTRWADLVAAIAEPHGLDTDLVLAVVAQESSGRPGAWNPEPHYRWFWDISANSPFRVVTDSEVASQRPPDDFDGDDAEWWGQQSSWGLLQVMGAVARERGFAAVDLPDLCVPWIGIRYGIAQLVHLRKRFGSGDDMLATYNGGPGAKGGNRDYVAAIHRRLKELTS